MMLNLMYPALSSPLFKGVEAYFFLDRYLEEVDDVLDLPSVRMSASPCRATRARARRRRR